MTQRFSNFEGDPVDSLIASKVKAIEQQRFYGSALERPDNFLSVGEQRSSTIHGSFSSSRISKSGRRGAMQDGKSGAKITKNPTTKSEKEKLGRSNSVPKKEYKRKNTT